MLEYLFYIQIIYIKKKLRKKSQALHVKTINNKAILIV